MSIFERAYIMSASVSECDFLRFFLKMQCPWLKKTLHWSTSGWTPKRCWRAMTSKWRNLVWWEHHQLIASVSVFVPLDLRHGEIPDQLILHSLRLFALACIRVRLGKKLRAWHLLAQKTPRLTPTRQHRKVEERGAGEDGPDSCWAVVPVAS